MRNTPNVRAERGRITDHPELASDASYGNNGAFVFKFKGVDLYAIISDEHSWDHVSVHPDTNPPRTPTWEEMCHIKDIFFRDDEIVVQFHPDKKSHISYHNTTLHLWRNQNFLYTLPPYWMVGPKEGQSVGDLQREAAAAVAREEAS
jgi:hypothetical protein